MKVWILTREINEYDQDGEYFEAVFGHVPTLKDLEKHITGIKEKYRQHLLKGGGRIEVEEEWYFLKEYKID